jgi:hypothetical protein
MPMLIKTTEKIIIIVAFQDATSFSSTKGERLAKINIHNAVRSIEDIIP